MADLPSRLDLFALGRDFVIQRAKKIDPGQVDIAGSDVNIIVGVASVMADAVTKQLGYRSAALTLDGSDDDDLDRYAFDRYSEIRKGASSALTTGVISRLAATAGAGTVPVGTKVQTTTGVEYITTTSASFGVSDLTSQARLRAVQAGKATQVGANQIARFSNPGSLFDKNLLITNPEPSAGGEDAEDDETFRARVRDFWRTARRGVLSAIEFGALSVEGVVSAQAIEAVSSGGLPARIVVLYIADSSGVASTALAEKVRQQLEDFRAGGIGVLISTSLPLLVNIALRLQFRANVDTETLTDNILASIVEFVNTIPVNGTLSVSGLYSVLERYREDGLLVSKDSLVAPTGDLVPATGQTIRTTLANITVVP